MPAMGRTDRANRQRRLPTQIPPRVNGHRVPASGQKEERAEGEGFGVVLIEREFLIGA